MIIKAGVPSNKVDVGIASYGRSFKMAQAGCMGPSCLFTGSAGESNALPGICTNIAGYISRAGIDRIIEEGNLGVVYNKDSDSEIIVYGDDETDWGAYMDDDTKSKHEKLYATYNMAGTSDWAVDLHAFDMPDELDGVTPEPEDHGIPLEWEDCEDDSGDYVELDCPNKYFTLDDLERDNC